MKAIGRMERIDDLRTVWPHEEHDFSKWLAEEENLSDLGETLGIEMELEETESPVGNFSVDIFARESGTSRGVIIENQLEDTDHDHLGKIITYAAGKEADVIIWIVKHARDEHKQAVSWLNQHTDEDIGIFLVEIELWRIGDSLPAPKFNIVERPNEWAKTVKAAEVLTPLKKFQLSFWQQFAEYAFQPGTPFSKTFGRRKAFATNWYNLSTGTASVVVEFTINVARHVATAGLYIFAKRNDIYEQLSQMDASSAEMLGAPVEWSQGEKDWRMFVTRPLGDDFAKQNYTTYFDWFMKEALALRKIVGKCK